ncbi:MAG: enoyl-CoA hydratase/isomerase family protein [Gammaproteobacteria bacterium]|nr:enoyl-CoA hydratase/isomerase family protein [Gammaproteobacteria bacterium]
MMLRIERDPRGTATLILDRPAERNALCAQLIGELTDALTKLAAERDLRAVLLKGGGSAFCAGADIGEMRAAGAAAPEQNVADARRFVALLDRLERMPQPTIAVVNGAAYGGAIGLIAACDIAIAGGAARFSLSEVRLGLVPAMISPYVMRAIGARQARRYMLSGEVMDAATAERIGLVHEVVSDAALLSAVERLIDALLAGGPCAQVEIKSLLRHVSGRTDTDDTALRGELAQWIARIRGSAEGREGLSAFLEKRQAQWRDPG